MITVIFTPLIDEIVGSASAILIMLYFVNKWENQKIKDNETSPRNWNDPSAWLGGNPSSKSWTKSHTRPIWILPGINAQWTGIQGHDPAGGRRSESCDHLDIFRRHQTRNEMKTIYPSKPTKDINEWFRYIHRKALKRVTPEKIIQDPKNVSEWLTYIRQQRNSRCRWRL